MHADARNASPVLARRSPPPVPSACAAPAIVTSGADDAIEASLTRAGRLVVPESPALPAAVAALLGTATPLQLLTERIARARGTNPDPIRRDDARYLAASGLGEA